jgi:hypothetical protein
MGILMKTTLIRAALLSLAACTRLLAAAPAAPSPSGAPLPAEHLTVTTMPPDSPHRIYVLDEAFYNEIDSRIDIFDGDTYRRLAKPAWSEPLTTRAAAAARAPTWSNSPTTRH